MSKNNEDVLHLWFKPYNGVLSDVELSFVERYARRFYPKALSEVAKHLHRLAAKITRTYPSGAFEYQLSHITHGDTKRYSIQESLTDLSNENGLNFGIQTTTQDERQLFAQCFEQESYGQSVQSVLTYLKDVIEMQSDRWENIRLHSGVDAFPALKEIMEFLNNVRNHVRVYAFELNETEQGKLFTLALIAPSVLSYYVRFDWTIV